MPAANAAEHHRWRVPRLIDAQAKTPYCNLPLADGALALWMLDETSGTSAADTTGNGHTGTYEGSPTLGQPGPVGRSVQLNGSSQYISVATLTGFPTTGAYTLEAIVNLASASQDATALGYGDNGTRHLNALRITAAILRSWWSFDDYDVSAIEVAGLWVHYAMTYDGSTRRTYRNGRQVGLPNTPTGTPNFTLTNFRIGSVLTTTFLNGYIQAVAIYGTALTQTQINAHAAAAGLL